MEYEVFDREWQRVAVDKCFNTTHDQLQDILSYVEKLDYVESLERTLGRELTLSEMAAEQGRQFLQRRVWVTRSLSKWQFRNEDGEWEDA